MMKSAWVDYARWHATEDRGNRFCPPVLFAVIVNPAMPTFNTLCEKALAIPGVSDQLKPTIDNLRVKLTRLTV